MTCKKCGKEISSNERFCSYCGTENGVHINTQPDSIFANDEIKPKKNITLKKVIAIVLAIVVGSFIGENIFAPAMTPDSGTNDVTGNQGSQLQQTDESDNNSSVEADNPAYDEVFEGTYIVHFPMFFNMETESFAFKKEDGTIYCADYGYKDDVIKQFIETMYIPISEYTDAQKTEIENTNKAQFAAIDALACCTVTYETSVNYFTITCTYSDTDKAENYGELYNAGILQTNTFPSMSATESGLLSQGFIKK